MMSPQPFLAILLLVGRSTRASPGDLLAQRSTHDVAIPFISVRLRAAACNGRGPPRQRIWTQPSLLPIAAQLLPPKVN